MPTVLITGGTGMVGRALTAALLERGYDIIILTRNPGGNNKPAKSRGVEFDTSRISYSSWDIDDQVIDKDAITKADYIIHLAGANLREKRWTKKRKKIIIESRIKSSALIIKALSENANQVKAVISASAIGWYGEGPASAGGQLKIYFTETDPPAENFLGQACRKWEESIEPVSFLGKRLVKLRTGVVLTKEGGAVREIKKYLHFGLAAIPGNGKQIMSWIHIDDLVRLYMYALENEQLNGVFNAVAPRPISYKEFILALARKMKGKFFIAIHAPSFIVYLVLGELSNEILKSANAGSSKIQDAGFIFQYPTVQSALETLK